MYILADEIVKTQDFYMNKDDFGKNIFTEIRIFLF